MNAGSQSADPYVGMGLVAFRQGRAEEGLTYFQAAVALEPEVSIYHSYLAKALYQVGRRDEALAELERARALDPRDPTPDLYKGVFLRDLNRPAEAIEALQKSVELNDNRAVYRSRLLLDRDLATRNTDLTRAYLNLNQNERALALSVRALQEDPQSSAAHLYYASVVGLGLGATNICLSTCR
jgi:tetratricopeptide (TPR) repeat protein